MPVRLLGGLSIISIGLPLQLISCKRSLYILFARVYYRLNRVSSIIHRFHRKPMKLRCRYGWPKCRLDCAFTNITTCSTSHVLYHQHSGACIHPATAAPPSINCLEQFETCRFYCSTRSNRKIAAIGGRGLEGGGAYQPQRIFLVGLSTWQSQVDVNVV